jgi:hypothetical protein
VAHLVDDSALALRVREHRLDGRLEAGQPIDTGQEDVLDATRLQVRHDAQPEVRAFGAIAHPVAKHITLALQIDAQYDVDAVFSTLPSRRSLRWIASR